jgi:tRNA nucleotidyltransferase (CCA-adding enzyme)
MCLSDVGELPGRFASLPGSRQARAAAAGSEVYLVGGAVRDLWLGGTPLDLDLVIVGELDPLLASLAGEASTHTRFGTATIRGDGGVRFDLARARRETYARPGALPEVAAAGIEQDLGRRDFTVNALALGLSGANAGRLLAAPHAVEDLAAHRLRVLHPASFLDDPTRLLRLARYAARLGFSVEPGTEALARAALSAGALATVSGARLGAELTLLAAERDPVAGFAELHRLEVDGALAPGFGITDPGLAERALSRLPADGDPAALLLGLAGTGVASGRRRPLLHRLGLPAGRREAALAAAEAPVLAKRLALAARPSEVAAAVGGAPVEATAIAGAYGPAPVGRRAHDWLTAWRHTRPDIGGEDLIAAGVAPGPAIAAGLRAALAAKLDGEAPTRAEQLAVALRAATPGPG